MLGLEMLGLMMLGLLGAAFPGFGGSEEDEHDHEDEEQGATTGRGASDEDDLLADDRQDDSDTGETDDASAEPDSDPATQASSTRFAAAGDGEAEDLPEDAAESAGGSGEDDFDEAAFDGELKDSPLAAATATGSPGDAQDDWGWDEDHPFTEQDDALAADVGRGEAVVPGSFGLYAATLADADGAAEAGVDDWHEDWGWDEDHPFAALHADAEGPETPEAGAEPPPQQGGDGAPFDEETGAAESRPDADDDGATGADTADDGIAATEAPAESGAPSGAEVPAAGEDETAPEDVPAFDDFVAGIDQLQITLYDAPATPGYSLASDGAGGTLVIANGEVQAVLVGIAPEDVGPDDISLFYDP